jgi:hypothetical protein
MSDNIIIKLALVGPGGNAVYHEIQVHSLNLKSFTVHELRRKAILLSLGISPFKTFAVVEDADLYKVTFVYTDIDGNEALLASDSDLQFAMRQFSEKGSSFCSVVKVFASVKNMKVKQESPTLELATETLTQTVHPATAVTTPQTSETGHFYIKLALVNSEGKKVDSSASLKRLPRVS